MNHKINLTLGLTCLLLSLTAISLSGASLPAAATARAGLSLQTTFAVKDYGAKGDCHSVFDVSATSGSPTITSATANFSSEDVGKVLVLSLGLPYHSPATINATTTVTGLASTSTLAVGMSVMGHGSNVGMPFLETIASIDSGSQIHMSQPATGKGQITLYFQPAYLVTTIASVTDPTTAVLADNSTFTGSGLHAIYGTDDTAAIQKAINAAVAVNGCTVTFDALTYMVAGALQDPGVRNSVLTLPNVAAGTSTTGPLGAITLKGCGSTSGIYVGIFPHDNSSTGCTVLYCPTVASGKNPSIISGSTLTGMQEGVPPMTDFTLFVKDLVLRVPVGSKLHGINAYAMGGCDLDDVVADIDYPGTYGNKSRADNNTAIAFRMPNFMSNQIARINRCAVENWGVGIYGEDHLTVTNTSLASNNIGIELGQGTIKLHAVEFVGDDLGIFSGTGPVATQLDADGITFEDGNLWNAATAFHVSGDLAEKNPGRTTGFLSGGSNTGYSITGSPPKFLTLFDLGYGIGGNGVTQGFTFVAPDVGRNIYYQFMSPNLKATDGLNLAFGKSLSPTDCGVLCFNQPGPSGSASSSASVGIKGVTTKLYVFATGDLSNTPTDGGHALDITGDIASSAMIIKSGSNALAGTVTLSSGRATISSTAIDANTVIMFSLKSVRGKPAPYQPVATVSEGSAVVTGAATDDSTYNWAAIKVN